MESKKVRGSRTVKAMLVLPPDSNALGTMFGGKVMSYIDDIASISAFRHARKQVVTASTDSVDFLYPIKVGEMICMESFVTWTHRTSMEVYVSIISENVMTGERRVCATSFLTFVAIDENGKTLEVPPVVPESQNLKRNYIIPRRIVLNAVWNVNSIPKNWPVCSRWNG